MIPNIGNAYRHGRLRLPWQTFVLSLIVFALYVFGGTAPEALVFERQTIMQGEIWRLMTGHWVHADWEHLAWNLVALGILGWMLEISLGYARLYMALLVGMCVVSGWVWWFTPMIDYYCGLSGILNTLLFIMLIDSWQKTRKLIFPFVLVGATAKISWEIMQASAIFTNTSWPTVPEAHLAGAMAAVLLIFYQAAIKRPA